MPDQALDILLVEDEPLIAMTATDLLDAIGHRVATTAPSITSALNAVELGGFDVAMLDLNLNDESSIPVADRLRAAGKPYFFTTGYTANAIEAPHGDVPILTKPYTLSELETAIQSLFGGPAPVD